MLLSHPRCQSCLQILQGVIERSVVFLPFPDQATFIKGSDEGPAHVILANLHLAILHHPPGNGWVGRVEVQCHGSFTYVWFFQDALTPTNRQVSLHPVH